MNKGRNAAKIGAVFLTALIVVLSVCTVYGAQRVSWQKNELTAHNNGLAAPYISENARLAGQIVKLNARVESISRQGLKMSVTIFVQCGTNLYERCYPIAKRYGTAGVFVISGDQMIGRAGCITAEQYDRLLSDGWTAAIALPEHKEQAEAYLQSLSEEFLSLERAFPDAVYLSAEQFTKENLELLKQKGFKTFLHEYQEAYYEGFDPTMYAEDDPVYIPYLYLAQDKKVFPIYQEITQEGGCCALATRNVVYANEFGGQSGADPALDSVVGVMGNVYEVVVAEFGYHRTVKDYRAQIYRTYSDLAEEKAALMAQIMEIREERKRLNGLIYEIYREELTL